MEALWHNGWCAGHSGLGGVCSNPSRVIVFCSWAPFRSIHRCLAVDFDGMMLLRDVGY